MKELSSLKEYEKNNKIHNEEQISLLVQNIDKFGFTTPLLIDKDNVLIAGHGRKLAGEKLGIKKVPCIMIDDLKENEIKALRIADNKLNAMGEDNLAFIKEEWLELSESGLDFLTGWKEEEFDFEEESTEVEEDDFEAPDDVEEIKTEIKRGDVIKLGRHRLMCGSSTELKDVELLTEQKKLDMCFTDPPYGMKKENDGVLNDNLNYSDLLKFNKKWIPISLDNLKDVGSWYCWGIDEPLMDIYSEILKPMAKNNEITFRNLITWNKGSGQGQMSEDFRMYPVADEKCLFVMKGVQGFNTNSDNYFEKWEPIRIYLYNERVKCGWDIPTMKKIVGHSDLSRDHWTSKSQWSLIPEYCYKLLQQEAKGKAFKKEYEEIKKEYEKIKKEYYSTRSYFNNTHDNQNNVWHFDRTSNQERETTGGHATPKPLELCSRAIMSSSRENETVLDLFGGSGSTLIACEQLKRQCYMMELDEKYCEVICQRWEKLTNKKREVLYD